MDGEVRRRGGGWRSKKRMRIKNEELKEKRSRMRKTQEKEVAGEEEGKVKKRE